MCNFLQLFAHLQGALTAVYHLRNSTDNHPFFLLDFFGLFCTFTPLFYGGNKRQFCPFFMFAFSCKIRNFQIGERLLFYARNFSDFLKISRSIFGKRFDVIRARPCRFQARFAYQIFPQDLTKYLGLISTKIKLRARFLLSLGKSAENSMLSPFATRLYHFAPTRAARTESQRSSELLSAVYGTHFRHCKDCCAKLR